MRRGVFIEDHTSYDLTKVEEGLKAQDMVCTESVFVLPGDYAVSLAIFDTATKEHSVKKSQAAHCLEDRPFAGRMAEISRRSSSSRASNRPIIGSCPRKREAESPRDAPAADAHRCAGESDAFPTELSAQFWSAGSQPQHHHPVFEVISKCPHLDSS